MHFVFEAKADGTNWVAGWSGLIPGSGIDGAVIVTQSGIKSCLAWSIHDAITTLLSETPKANEGFTFEILYV